MADSSRSQDPRALNREQLARWLSSAASSRWRWKRVQRSGRQQRFDGFRPISCLNPNAALSLAEERQLTAAGLRRCGICRKAAADGWSPTRANGCMSCDSADPLRRWHHHGCDWRRSTRLHRSRACSTVADTAPGSGTQIGGATGRHRSAAGARPAEALPARPCYAPAVGSKLWWFETATIVATITLQRFRQSAQSESGDPGTSARTTVGQGDTVSAGKRFSSWRISRQQRLYAGATVRWPDQGRTLRGRSGSVDRGAGKQRRRGAIRSIGRLMPVYGLTEGVAADRFRQLIDQVCLGRACRIPQPVEPAWSLVSFGRVSGSA